jgi:hypothetical protein
MFHNHCDWQCCKRFRAAAEGRARCVFPPNAAASVPQVRYARLVLHLLRYRLALTSPQLLHFSVCGIFNVHLPHIHG